MGALLEGLRVVEVATFVAGPAAGTLLADYGAEVIHVEPPSGDAYRKLYQLRPLPECEENYGWLLDSRNKLSVALNLKHEDGRAALYRLVDSADVLITNYQPSVLNDLKVRYEDLRERNPRLIYAHITGYGEQGDEVECPGYDATAWWARSGLMDFARVSGGEVGPSAPGMGDHPTSVALFSAIMLGLYRRQQTGLGGKVGTSLMANGLWSNAIMAQAALCGATPTPRWNHAAAPNPLLTVYRTRDERFLSLAMVKEADEWPLFCAAIARSDLEHEPRFVTSPARRANARALVALLDEVFATRTLDEWMRAFNHHRITYGLVQQSFALPQDPQMRANGLFRPIVDMPGRETVDSPIYVEGAHKVAAHKAPEIGQHTRALLARVGYGQDEIERLVASGAAAG